MVAPFHLGSLTLASPVIMAAGLCGYAVPAPVGPAPMPSQDYSTVPPIAEGLIGAAITASISWRTRRGAPPRFHETPAGVRLVPGTARSGAADVLRRYARAWERSAAPIIASIVGDDAAQYASIAIELEGTRGLAALELNLAATLRESDTDARGPLDSPPVLAALIRGVTHQCSLPVIVKLPLSVAGHAGLLRAGAAGGAVAITIGGGVPTSGGWLVGPATFPLVLDAVAQAARTSPLPLLASGGIVAAAGGERMLRAGATAVQIGSALLANPLAAAQIASKLAAAD